MKSSEYYEHQLNEEQLRSDQLQDQIDTLKCQLDDLKAERKELVEALRLLYTETADYITVNNLGDVHHNQSMKSAQAILKKSSETP